MKKFKNLTTLELQLNELYETHKIIIPKEAFPYLRNAQIIFAEKAIREERKRRRENMIKILKPLPKLFRLAYWYFFKQYLRKNFCKIATRTAKARAVAEGYRIYVIRSTELTYTTVSTREFNQGKKIKSFGRDLNFMDIEKESSFIANPPKHKP